MALLQQHACKRNTTQTRAHIAQKLTPIQPALAPQILVTVTAHASLPIPRLVVHSRKVVGRSKRRPYLTKDDS